MKHFLFLRINNIINHCSYHIIFFYSFQFLTLWSNDKSINYWMTWSVQKQTIQIIIICTCSSEQWRIYSYCKFQICRVGIIKSITLNIKSHNITSFELTSLYWSKLYNLYLILYCFGFYVCIVYAGRNNFFHFLFYLLLIIIINYL